MAVMWLKFNRSPWIVLCITLLCHEFSCPSDGMPGPSCHHHFCEFRMREKDFLACKNDARVCVRDPQDCDLGDSPLVPDPVSLHISCYFDPVVFALSCSWHDESANPTYSLIFSQSSPVYCPALLNRNGHFNITLKQRVKKREEHRFTRHLVDIRKAVKAPVPFITSVNTTDASLSVVWTVDRQEHLRCRVRYRGGTNHTWIQASDVSTKRRKTCVYVINGLQPYTNYAVSVACVGSGHWSEWSAETIGKTVERAPSKSLEVCFHMEPTTFSEGPHNLTLMWKALDVQEAGGYVLGHQVRYTSPTENSGGWYQNVTADTLRTVMEVWEERGNITVVAYNKAGFSPPSHPVHPVARGAVPSVRSLWVKSTEGSLMVEWDMEASPLRVSEFAIEWTSHTLPASSHWCRVDGHRRSAVLADHVQSLQTYDVSVYPIYHRLCGPPQRLAASLEHGVHLKAVGLQVVVTETKVTVDWLWEKRSHRRVGEYRLVLRQGKEEQAVSVWPDINRHTFLDLSAHTEYSVHLVADNVSTEIYPFTTSTSYYTETVVTIPLILLALCLGLLAVLSRTRYKKYFYPQVADPQVSRIGQWLLKPQCEEAVMKSILKLEDFLVTDLMGGKGLTELHLEPRTEEELRSTHATLCYSPLTLTHTGPRQAYQGPGGLQLAPSPSPRSPKCIVPSLLSPSWVDCPPQSEPKRPPEPEDPSIAPEKHQTLPCILEYIQIPGNSSTIECEADYIPFVSDDNIAASSRDT